MKKYANVLSPIRVGKLVLKSRFVSGNSLPHFLQGPESWPAESVINHVTSCARNGAAIVTDLVTLAKTDKSLPYLTITTSSDQLALLIEQLVREKSATPATPADERDVLSVREREILVLLAQGLSNKEIADRLFLSVYTVMTHRRNICQKLNIHSVSGLTIYAIANKLMEL